MSRTTFRTTLALAATLASALALPARADVTGSLRVTRDTEEFSERLSTLGWTDKSGLGVRAGLAMYQAPGWHRAGPLLLGTYERQQQGEQLQLSAGFADMSSHTHAIGHLDYLRRVAPSTALGISLERHYVDSIRSLEQGVTFNHAALVLEQVLAPQFELGASLGVARFSNDNTRSQLRTRWTYELQPESGRYAYLKTRHYANSNPYRPEYFSPDELAEVSLGLARRTRLTPDVVLAVEGDYGRQETESASRPLWGFGLSLSAPRGQQPNWRVGVQLSNSASSASAGSHYRYTSFSAQITMPF